VNYPNASSGQLNWTVIDNGDDTFTYTYTFTGFVKPGISHFTLDISEDAVSGETLLPGVIVNPTLNGDPTSVVVGDPQHAQAAGMDTSNVKFDESPDADSVTYSFTSNRTPVWHDFYLKSGRDSEAYNTGLNNHASEDKIDFIPTPNSPTPNSAIIPEPSTVLLFGFGILSIVGYVWHRRKKAA
jgi:hypothetical protein